MHFIEWKLLNIGSAVCSWCGIDSYPALLRMLVHYLNQRWSKSMTQCGITRGPSQYKDAFLPCLSYLHNGNRHTWKDVFCIDTGSWPQFIHTYCHCVCFWPDVRVSSFFRTCRGISLCPSRSWWVWCRTCSPLLLGYQEPSCHWLQCILHVSFCGKLRMWLGIYRQVCNIRPTLVGN